MSASSATSHGGLSVEAAAKWPGLAFDKAGLEEPNRYAGPPRLPTWESHRTRPDAPLPPHAELRIFDLAAHGGQFESEDAFAVQVLKEYSRVASTAPGIRQDFAERGATVTGLRVAAIAGSTDDLRSADTVAAVVAALRRRSRNRIAGRIEELAASDHDEPVQPEIDLDSLKRAVAVVLEHPRWGEPEITLRDDRYLHLAWALKGDGRVAISFLPQDRVRFSALSAPTSVPGFLNIGGRHRQRPAIGILSWFFASSPDDR